MIIEALLGAPTVRLSVRPSVRPSSRRGLTPRSPGRHLCFFLLADLASFAWLRRASEVGAPGIIKRTTLILMSPEF